MICSVDIKRGYIKLYDEMRNYLWDYNAVCILAEVEKCVLTRFPDMGKLRRCLSQLGCETSEVRRVDKNLDKAYKDMQKAVDKNECSYSYITVNVK